MAFPVILYDSILRTTGVTLAASSTESGFSVNDLADLKGWKIWKSGTLVTGITIDIDMGSDTGSVNTIGIVNHNITSEAGTIEVRADLAAGPNPPTTVRQAAYTPTYGDVDIKTFTLASNLRRWRLVLAKGGNFTNKPYLGEVFLGTRITFPDQLNPDTDPFLKGVDGSLARSHGGQALGAVLRGQMHRFTLEFGGDAGMTRTFYTSDLNAFIDNHLFRYRPFIFQIDSDDSDFKRPVYVVRGEGATVDRRAVGGVWSRLILSCPVEEAHSEAV